MVTLIILDGFGLRKSSFGNAIKCAGTPNLDKLQKKYYYAELEASGKFVGLPDGQMGNSEVGHLTLGAGRVIYQDLMRINNDIEKGEFKNNPALCEALKHAQDNKSSLHLMGLLSNGGVHSQLSHLYEIIEAAKEYNIENIYIHAFMDGRDTSPTSGKSFIEAFENKTKGRNVSFASICGRIYAMDREKRYERVEKAYNMLVDNVGEKFNDTVSAIKNSYENGKTDEFVEPCIINEKGNIKDSDSMIFFNYRSDRAREITEAFTQEKFAQFKTKKFKNLLYTCMTEYSDEFANLNTLYPPQTITDNLSAIIAKNGLKQYHIAETTKYAHVTFFFNGGIEKPYAGEERKLIDSIDTQDFSNYPKMRAIEITTQTLEAIASCEYDFILVNYSNPDMIGHTGNFNATKEAITCVEKQAYALALATLMAGGDCIITADHGNAELMFDKNGDKVTSHTTNKVPFILVTDKKVKIKKQESIASIAPTVLKLLDLEIPPTMAKPLI